jgi:hypothetical protein
MLSQKSLAWYLFPLSIRGSGEGACFSKEDENAAQIDFNMTLELTFKSLWACFALPLNRGNTLQEYCEAVIRYCVW